LKKAEAFTRGYRKVILVSLELWYTEIEELVSNSPKDWIWVLRPHPGTKDHYDEMREFFRTVHPNVEMNLAIELPLHVLILVADIHISWFSTCALECLPFGVKTIFIHPSAKVMYNEFITSGRMVYVEHPLDAIELIESSEPLENIQQDSYATFSGNDDTRKACEFLKCRGDD
ncbi:hypothetical protein BVX99_00505, partial [bacterium F16]